MNLTRLLAELTEDAKWNLDYIFNDLQTRVTKSPNAPNFGLKGIVEMVRQEYFLYHSRGKRRYGIMVWFYPQIGSGQIREVEQFIKKIYKDIFTKYNFKTQINNKLLKIILDEEPTE